MSARTKQDIDQEYTSHAMQAGHKARVMKQIQAEVDAHLAKLVELNAEAVTLEAAEKAAPVKEEKINEVA